MRASRRKNRGHNLLEAVIAGIIFSVVTVFLMGIWDMQFKAMLKSKETAVASFLAERVMEQCIAAGVDGNDRGVRDTVRYPQPYEELITVRSRTKKGEKLTEYTVVIDVPRLPDPQAHPDSSQQIVVVQVKYTDSTGERSVSYHTVLNEHG